MKKEIPEDIAETVLYLIVSLGVASLFLAACIVGIAK